jgi:uncharacterized membrane protein (Fun14 family)
MFEKFIKKEVTNTLKKEFDTKSIAIGIGIGICIGFLIGRTLKANTIIVIK